MLFAFRILAFILGSIRPGFNTFAVLLVILPFTDISSTVGVSVATVAMSLVVLPLAFVNVTVSVD